MRKILSVISCALSTHAHSCHIFLSVCVCTSQGMSWVDDQDGRGGGGGGGKGQLFNTHEDQIVEWMIRSYHIHTKRSQHTQTGWMQTLAESVLIYTSPSSNMH